MFKLSASNLFRHKVRTVLSLLGIIIGVTAIISIVSIIDGISFDVQNAVGQMQGVMIYEKGSMGPMFSSISRDYESELEKISGVKYVIPTEIVVAKSVEGQSVELGMVTVRIVGTDYSKKSYQTAAGIGGELLEGRSLKHSDSGKVVVGEDLMDEFNKFLGNKLDVEGEKFEIIGVYRTGSQMFNSSILMTLEDLQELRGLQKDKIAQYNIELINPDEDQKVIKLIEFKYGDELDAISTSDFSAQIAEFIGMLRLLVMSVAGLAAVVAGMGILNTMLMSVTERFKEIGTLKATGWSKANIIQMIVLESFMIGIIGGVLGVGVGMLVSFIMQTQMGVTSIVTLPLLGQAMGFALAIGLFAGIYPAYAASRVDPVEVLQHE